MKNTVTETIKSVNYSNGSRIATIEQVISRADDCAEIGNLYYRLSDYYRSFELTGTNEEREAILKDIAEVKEKIEIYTSYLAGYSE